MGTQNSVMILGGNLDIGSSLQSELKTLGFKPFMGRYPDVDTDGIVRKAPEAILLDLTAGNSKDLSIGEFLLYDDILPVEIALVALVSDSTMEQIPLDYKFADIIIFPCDIAELGFRLRRVIYHYHK